MTNVTIRPDTWVIFIAHTLREFRERVAKEGMDERVFVLAAETFADHFADHLLLFDRRAFLLAAGVQ